jgi:integrase
MPAYFDEIQRQWRWRKSGVKLPDGAKCRPISGTPNINTKAAAEQGERDAIEQILAKARAGLDPFGPSIEEQRRPKTKSVPLFEDFSADWLKKAVTAEGVRPSTMKKHVSNLRIHLIPFLKGKRLDEITPEVFDELVAKLKGAKLHGGKLLKVTERGERPQLRERNILTIQNITQTLRKCLRRAAAYGHLNTMPEFTKLKLPKELPFEFYSMDEREKIVGAARDQDERALFMLAFRTGLRAGEQLALGWSDITFSELPSGQVRAKIIVRFNCHDGVINPTKTGFSREVPVSGELATLLQEIEADSRARGEGRFVFSDEHGRHLTISNLRSRLRWACKRAGVRLLRWHDLRHSFASHAMMRGVPIKQVQAWMGHSDITMTMRYAHLQPSMTDQMIEVIDAAPTAQMGKVIALPSRDKSDAQPKRSSRSRT